jgi:hypothetical protein
MQLSLPFTKEPFKVHCVAVPSLPLSKPWGGCQLPRSFFFFFFFDCRFGFGTYLGTVWTRGKIFVSSGSNNVAQIDFFEILFLFFAAL